MSLDELVLNAGRLEDLRDRLVTAVAYLRYYYNIDEDSDQQEVREAIMAFQTNFDLTVDGVLGPKTLGAMNYHRCGHPDWEPLRKRRPATTPNKWGITKLTWFINNLVSGFSQEEQRAIYARSFNEISKVCGLQFSEVLSKNQANLVILTSSAGELGSPGNVLAFAFLPPRPNFTGQLTLTLDLAETWIDDSRKRGILLQNVFTHEIFHNLAITHSTVKTALMAPFYSPNIAIPQINDDVPRIQALYGPALAPPVPPVIPPVVPPVIPPVTPPVPPVVPPVPPVVPPVVPPIPKTTVIKLTGDVSKIEIEGYRITKLG